MPFITTFLYSQLFVTLPYPTYDFSGQTIIVTGSNSGLGLEAARHFIRLDAAKVILAVRTVAKGNAAAGDISSSTETPPDRIEVWQLDLSSSDSVKAFASRVQGLDRLDVVVENAGILTTTHELLEGEESTITVNVVNTVLCGLVVLPKLRDSARKHSTTGRLVFVGSDLQLAAKFTEQHEPGSLFTALRSRETANMPDRFVYLLVYFSKFIDAYRLQIKPLLSHTSYPTSKLLQLYAVRAIASMSPVTPESPVVINYLTPGACKSDIFRDPKDWFSKLISELMQAIIARTTEAGSRTLIHASKPDIEKECHGKFLMDCKIWPYDFTLISDCIINIVD